MKKTITIVSLLITLCCSFSAQAGNGMIHKISFDFYGDSIIINNINTELVTYTKNLSKDNIQVYYKQMSESGYQPILETLKAYKEQHNPDDWLYYQLVRKTAQYLSPKESNYVQYTLYKWFLLSGTGFDARLSIADSHLLFYVQCDENIYDIPFYTSSNKQYVCLNYHDYGKIDFTSTPFLKVEIPVSGAVNGFSYKLTRMPAFSPTDYEEKDISFNYQNIDYRFRIKLNPKVKNIFANYPVADYQLYFNMPMSNATYASLIPQLKENIANMGTRQGVDYLMRFTRYSFLYQPDGIHFGKEKRMNAEQTLLYEGSDCEDRAALFFYLVKEIYNLPMLVLAYPDHVTVAVKFEKAIGKPIIYNGEKYTLCEPTPQRKDVPLGKVSPERNNSTYEVAFVYHPDSR